MINTPHNPSITTTTMSDLVTASTFQERMFERVRESLSELLTPDEAKALVEKAIEQSLFQRAKAYAAGWLF